MRIFLLALAIIDDLGAIVIIAVFYTGNLSVIALAGATIVIAFLFLLNRLHIARKAPYALFDILLWVLVLKSGVHATLAGVATSLALPIRRATGGSPLRELEHSLHPWTSFLVMPPFGFANAGLAFADVRLSDLAGGVALSLFLGKQLGVFGATALAIKHRLCEQQSGASWLAIYGVALIAGIGFTMSLFIGTLRWHDGAHAAALRFGVLTGSVVPALSGLCFLALGKRETR